jgi:hypothetical protein
VLVVEMSELVEAQAPREVVSAAGLWLAGELGPDGFAWSSSQLRLQRSWAGLHHQVHLQPSKYNRRGGPITVLAMLNVRDPALARWRRSHPNVAVGAGDFVCGHLLGYASGRANGYLYGDASDGVLDLGDPAGRVSQLVAWLGMVREGVLPWFTEASDPDLAVRSRAGECTNSPASLVEWLASRDRLDLVPDYLDWYVTKHPWASEPIEQARRASSQGVPLDSLAANSAATLGWVAARVVSTT